MNRWSMVVAVTVLGAGFWQASLLAQPAPPEKFSVAKLGPQVGEQVPDFSLKDQDGKTRDLHSIMGPKGAMLVFVRSADW